MPWRDVGGLLARCSQFVLMLLIWHRTNAMRASWVPYSARDTPQNPGANRNYLEISICWVDFGGAQKRTTKIAPKVVETSR